MQLLAAFYSERDEKDKATADAVELLLSTYPIADVTHSLRERYGTAPPFTVPGKRKPE
jgi:hypothetical protein